MRQAQEGSTKVVEEQAQPARAAAEAEAHPKASSHQQAGHQRQVSRSRWRVEQGLRLQVSRWVAGEYAVGKVQTGVGPQGSRKVAPNPAEAGVEIHPKAEVAVKEYCNQGLGGWEGAWVAVPLARVLRGKAG